MDQTLFDRVWELYLQLLEKEWYKVKPGMFYGSIEKHKLYFKQALAAALKEESDREYALSYSEKVRLLQERRAHVERELHFLVCGNPVGGVTVQLDGKPTHHE